MSGIRFRSKADIVNTNWGVIRMATDEIQALKLVLNVASSGETFRCASYFIDLRDNEWVIHAEVELSFRVSQSTGLLIRDEPRLDAAEALRIAREYAFSHSLSWHPAFSVVPEREGWNIGACQRQLGGQVHIAVGSDGHVITHRVNAK